MTPIVRIEDLRVAFVSGGRLVEAVRGVSLETPRGGVHALVGESGSGKSVTALSILKLLPPRTARYPTGRIEFDGRDVFAMAPAELRRLRGDRVGVIFQEPMSSLNPLHTVGRQIGEPLTLHRSLRGDALRTRCVELLEQVGVRDPAARLDVYPHQLSGGQRQRVMIAMAIANEPDLLIADEPTTALDVTVQRQVMELLAQLTRERGMTLLIISHDLGVVRRYADTVTVMREGLVVEDGPATRVFQAPEDPYTQLLMRTDAGASPVPLAASEPVILKAEDVRVWFPVKRGVLKRTVDHVKAVDGVSLILRKGMSLGVVGESGSGKTTLGLALLRLNESRGVIRFAPDGERDAQAVRLDLLDQNAMRPYRARMQVVFQDPYGSLSPRMTVGDIVAEGLRVQGVAAEERDRRAAAALEEVGLDPDDRRRYPHEFSGGQRQRVAIARAMILEPEVVLLDEPTSSLDRAVQFQALQLLRRLQADRGLAYLFITHDLKLVRALCHETIVMRAGVVVESGPVEQVFTTPRQAYTRELVEAALGDGASSVPGASA